MKTLMFVFALFFAGSAQAEVPSYDCFMRGYAGRTEETASIRISVSAEAVAYTFLDLGNEDGNLPSTVTATLSSRQSSNPAYRRYDVTTDGTDIHTVVIASRMLQGDATGHLNLITGDSTSSTLTIYSCSRI